MEVLFKCSVILAIAFKFTIIPLDLTEEITYKVKLANIIKQLI